jgi:hypothetical protein
VCSARRGTTVMTCVEAMNEGPGAIDKGILPRNGLRGAPAPQTALYRAPSTGHRCVQIRAAVFILNQSRRRKDSTSRKGRSRVVPGLRMRGRCEYMLSMRLSTTSSFRLSRWRMSPQALRDRCRGRRKVPSARRQGPMSECSGASNTALIQRTHIRKSELLSSLLKMETSACAEREIEGSMSDGIVDEEESRSAQDACIGKENGMPGIRSFRTHPTTVFGRYLLGGPRGGKATANC